MFRRTCIEYLISLSAAEPRLSEPGRKLLGWLRRRYGDFDVVIEHGDVQVVRLSK